jgi:dynein heavy chain
MRGWTTYIKLEAMIKNLLTSLRAVTELQNPAIRERHWQQLMAATKVRHLLFSSFSHNSLLQVNKNCIYWPGNRLYFAQE